MSTILDEIAARKRQDLEQRRHETPAAQLEAMVAHLEPPLDFAGALRHDGLALIAEIKRASPSRGLLCPHFDPVALARCYADNGVAAISVLTEEHYFQGHLDHLAVVRSTARLPTLRKDFLLDPYHVLEARAFGADAVLLIAALLPEPELRDLISLAASLGMAALVEVHEETELARALSAGAQLIGINNRDLRTFTVDIETTHRLLPLVPKDCIVVSESGIQSRADVLKLQSWGVNAILVGEALVTAADIPMKIRELMGI